MSDITNNQRPVARVNLDGVRVDGGPLVKWWFDVFGFEAFEIAKDWMRDSGVKP